MSTLICGQARSFRTRLIFFLSLAAGVFSVVSVKAQEKDCSGCAIFPSITVYHSIQSARGNGVGFEAGTWKKEKGSFSYFFGSSLVWQSAPAVADKTSSNSAYKPVSMTMYVKGQFALGNKLYAVITPGIQDLSFFTLKAGVRYVIPLSNKVGIGLEPNYSVFQNVMAFNTNLHIALR